MPSGHAAQQSGALMTLPASSLGRRCHRSPLTRGWRYPPNTLGSHQSDTVAAACSHNLVSVKDRDEAAAAMASARPSLGDAPTVEEDASHMTCLARQSLRSIVLQISRTFNLAAEAWGAHAPPSGSGCIGMGDPRFCMMQRHSWGYPLDIGCPWQKAPGTITKTSKSGLGMCRW